MKGGDVMREKRKAEKSFFLVSFCFFGRGDLNTVTCGEERARASRGRSQEENVCLFEGVE